MKELGTKEVGHWKTGFYDVNERVYDYVNFRKNEDKCPNCNDLVYIKEGFKKKGSMFRGR